MRLSEGQVIDYTKGEQPYMDDRFLKQPEPVAQEVVVRTVDSNVNTPVTVTDGVKPDSVRVQGFSFSDVTFGSMPSVTDNRIQKLVDKVKARKEAIAAIDDTSPAAKSVLKTLDWVIASAEAL